MSEKTAGACFATWPTFMVLLVYKTQTKINFKTGISKIMRQFLPRARNFRMHMKNPSRPSRSERAKDVVLCTLPSPLRQTKENGNLAVPKGYEAMHVHNRQLFIWQPGRNGLSIASVFPVFPSSRTLCRAARNSPERASRTGKTGAKLLFLFERAMYRTAFCDCGQIPQTIRRTSPE